MFRKVLAVLALFGSLSLPAWGQESTSFLEYRNDDLDRELRLLFQNEEQRDDKGQIVTGNRLLDITAGIPAERRSEILAQLREWSNDGGLSGLAADFADEAFSPENAPKLIWRKVYYHINMERGSGYLDVTVQREGWPLKRFAVSILEGGLRIYQNTAPNAPWAYKLHAKGRAIRMMAYYEDGKLVTEFDENGFPDPRYRFYDVRDDACIDIHFPQVPLSEDTNPSGICIARCAFPGILATM